MPVCLLLFWALNEAITCKCLNLILLFKRFSKFRKGKLRCASMFTHHDSRWNWYLTIWRGLRSHTKVIFFVILKTEGLLTFNFSLYYHPLITNQGRTHNKKWNNHQQTKLMIVKHVFLKKCIEKRIDNKNTYVKMWRWQFFQSCYSRRLLWKNDLIYRMLTNQVLQCVSKKCLT